MNRALLMGSQLAAFCEITSIMVVEIRSDYARRFSRAFDCRRRDRTSGKILWERATRIIANNSQTRRVLPMIR
jgi:hypothetical protein